jgi:hypothetical protein
MLLGTSRDDSRFKAAFGKSVLNDGLYLLVVFNDEDNWQIFQGPKTPLLRFTALCRETLTRNSGFCSVAMRKKSAKPGRWLMASFPRTTLIAGRARLRFF